MKRFFAFGFVVCFALLGCGCKHTAQVFRMQSVTFAKNGESVTLFAKDLKELICDDYKPYGGVEDNYFFCLKFEDENKGKAVFLFSELGKDYVDVVADNFVVEHKGGNRIAIVFSNGSALQGTKTKNSIFVSANGVSYQFDKV